MLYSTIWEYTVQSLISQINAAGNDGIVMRICSPGGGPVESFGLIAKWKEYKGAKHTQTDGKADSAAAFMLCYSDKNKALDVSTFLFHRAAYPQWIESNNQVFTQQRRDELTTINGFYRTAMEAKMDIPAFERIAGFTLDEMFSLESRREVKLTAAQAKEIGLVDEIITITPEIKAFVESNVMRIAAESSGFEAAAQPPLPPAPTTTSTTHKTKNMTLAELKAQHPEAYAAAVQEGQTTERDRVASWMEFADIDAAAVKAGIEAGTELSRKDYAAFTRKGIEKAALGNIEAGNPDEVETPGDDGNKPAATAEAQKLEASMDEVDKMLKVGKYAPAKA